MAPHAPTTNTNLNKEGRKAAQQTYIDRQAAQPRKPKHNNHSHLGGEKGKKSEENQEKYMGEKRHRWKKKKKIKAKIQKKKKEASKANTCRQ